MMETISLTMEELNAAVTVAVNAAIEAREVRRRETLITRKACAQRLHVDLSTLWRWAKSGFLLPIRIAGRLYYSEEAILKIERGEREV